MIVYADVLIVLNLFVNFFILQLTARICRDAYRIGRLILAAFLGGLFSLYIFIPTLGVFLETLFKLVISALIVLTCFGFDSIKSFIRRVLVFFSATFLFAGCMMGIWALFKTNRLAINNGIVYIDISPLLLVVTTFACYIILSVIRYFSSKHAYNGKRCNLQITYSGRTANLTALVDTGHSLTDTMTEREVVIIEQSIALKLLDFVPTLEAVTASSNPPHGFRMIPYSSVGGHGLLPAFIPDEIYFEINRKKHLLNNILIAVTQEALGEDYKGIISPTVLST